ncbi:MAG: hypothetical protein EU541_03795 [Promethearchaeota archaeon]|nr:MAG: hypothetical protein EU541_03795 [Candidatus Lokiarchaeota archaeon]
MIVLCLGNSLTAGYPGYSPAIDGVSKGYGDIKSQYEFWLKHYCLEYLEKNLGSVNDYILENLIFVNKGVPGELTRNLLNRIAPDLLNYLPKPNYSIIIGGTNDLGWGISEEKIINNLQALHMRSRDENITSIGATIPPIRQEQSSPHYNRRKVSINRKLISFFKKYEIPYADLYHGMANNKGNLRKDCAYSDGLHFSAEGYRIMGKVLFKDVFKSIVISKWLD